MKTAGILLTLTVLALAAPCSALLRQPETVPGQMTTAEAGRDGRAPGEASHTTDATGRWRAHRGNLPSLADVNAMPDDPTPIYGLYVDPSLYLMFRDDIKAVGFSCFRLSCSPTSFTHIDPAIRAMVEDHATILLKLGAPRRDDFDSDEAYIRSALDAFGRTIERYGPGGTFFKANPDLPYRPVTDFQLLNEPNFQFMYKGTNNGAMIPIRHKLYAELMPRAYAMIKRRWPDVTVVGWSCGGAAAQDVLFVTNALKMNPATARSFDVFSTHPYIEPAPPEAFAIRSWGGYAITDTLAKIRSLFAEAGRPATTLPVWYTEGGWRLRHADGGMFPSGTLPAKLHAAYYVRYYAMGLRLGVSRITPMYAVDADNFNGGIFNRTTGWKRNDADPLRPVARAIQTMIRTMPNPKLKGILADGQDGFYAYEFLRDKLDDDAGTAVMAWTVTGGGRTVALPVPFGRATITDMFGATEDADVADGAVQATVGPCPIYVTEGTAR